MQFSVISQDESCMFLIVQTVNTEHLHASIPLRTFQMLHTHTFRKNVSGLFGRINFNEIRRTADIIESILKITHFRSTRRHSLFIIYYLWRIECAIVSGVRSDGELNSRYSLGNTRRNRRWRRSNWMESINKLTSSLSRRRYLSIWLFRLLHFLRTNSDQNAHCFSIATAQRLSLPPNIVEVDRHEAIETYLLSNKYPNIHKQEIASSAWMGNSHNSFHSA